MENPRALTAFALLISMLRVLKKYRSSTGLKYCTAIISILKTITNVSLFALTVCPEIGVSVPACRR